VTSEVATGSPDVRLLDKSGRTSGAEPPGGLPPTRSQRAAGAARTLGGNILLKLIPALVFFGLWEVWANRRDSLLVPNASETLTAVWDLLGDPEVWEALWLSNQALLLGFASTLVLGIPVGLLMGRVRAIEKMGDVWLNALLVSPMAMLMPIIIMSIGFDLRARALVVLIFSCPMVIVNTRAGVREVPTDLIEMARSFGANERLLWQKILISAASPAIWSGVRIGLGRAITGMVLGELLLVSVGIGRLLQLYKGTFEPHNTYALVVVIVAESLLLMSIVRRVERRVVPWATKDSFGTT
jgi:NitT/TauT family transport system permease protein